MKTRVAILVAGLGVACTHHHQAKIASGPIAPPEEPMVAHTNRLWIELEGTSDRQCERTPSERALCFAGVRDALGGAIERTLWPSFPGVRVKRKGDNVEPGDYLLHLRISVRSAAAGAEATYPGWAARAEGHWQLVRDGLPIGGESVSAQSESAFPYGRSLGKGGGEVLEAIALHIAGVLGQLPETRPLPKASRPAVTSTERTGVLTRLGAPSCQSSDDARRCSMASR